MSRRARRSALATVPRRPASDPAGVISTSSGRTPTTTSAELAVLGQLARVDEAERRRADVQVQEAGHEDVPRLVVDGLRRADLLDPAAIHHRHQVGQDQRLVVIVGHVHRGDAELAQQDLQVDAILLPQRLVEIGERLVDQEEGGVAGDAAAEGDALLLAARQRRRLAIQQVGELHPHQLAGPLVLGPGQRVQLRRLLPEQEVRQDVRPRGEVRVERVALKHHADAPVAGRDRPPRPRRRSAPRPNRAGSARR